MEGGGGGSAPLLRGFFPQLPTEKLYKGDEFTKLQRLEPTYIDVHKHKCKKYACNQIKYLSQGLRKYPHFLSRIRALAGNIKSHS